MIALAFIVALGVVDFILCIVLYRHECPRVPAREIAAFAGSKPSGVENREAPGDAPGDPAARPGSTSPGAVPHGRHHAGTGRSAGTSRLIAELNQQQADAAAAWYQPGFKLPRRRVNRGPDKPPWHTEPLPTLVDVAEQYHSMPEYGQAPVARVLGLADLGPADAQGRTLAERMMP